jgi:hypothetical protein
MCKPWKDERNGKKALGEFRMRMGNVRRLQAASHTE